jgi:sarcosine oxidase
MVDDWYDVAVIGIGTMGAATCWQLAEKGVRVIGLDQFHPPHDRGSHSGNSRIVRKAYFEHPDYVPLLELAYRGWGELERFTGEVVFERTGLLYFGPSHHRLISGLLESAAAYAIPVQAVEPSCYPLFHMPTDFASYLEPDAGFVRPERAIELMWQAARSLGAELRFQEPVNDWKECSNGFQLHTKKGSYFARKLVITAGAWGSKIVPSIGRHLEVTQQILAWVHAFVPAEVALGNLPCWTLADPLYPGIFYGFPELPVEGTSGPRGFKLAHHAPGTIVDDPDQVDPAVTHSALESIRDVLTRYFPGKFKAGIETRSCRYTNSPDGDFILDFLPPFGKDVVYALGFSGHGFKFAPAIGKVLADLAVSGKTEVPIGFLSAQRLKSA